MTDPLTSLTADLLLRSPGAAPVEHGSTLPIDAGVVADSPTGAPGASLRTGGLALPAMTNGHDHGKAFSTLCWGIPDGPLELWLPGTATRPRVSQELVSIVYFARSARAGIAASINLHALKPPEQLRDDARWVASAAEQVGVRVGFGVPLHDRNHLAYGDESTEAAILGGCGLHPDQVPIVPSEIPSTAEAIALVDEIAAAHDSDLVTVQFGPLAPQWISDELGLAIAERSAETGRRIHMHVLETRRQREWADATYPQGMIVHLDELGLLSERLSIAHGVNLRPDELELLAERGVTVATNPSSNLRLQNGIAPVVEMVRTGVQVALGLDGSALDDDDDYLRELRLMKLLHSGTGIEPDLNLATAFRIACDGGARAVHGGRGAYGLDAGAPADVVVLRTDFVDDVMEPYRDHASLAAARATNDHVSHLIVGGRVVVDDGKVVGVDEEAALAALTEEFLGKADEHLPHQAMLERLRPALADHYLSGGHTTGATAPTGGG